MSDIEQVLRSLLSGEFSSLTIELNEHASDYRTVAEVAEDRLYRDAWVSEESKARAIRENTAWTMRWYPETQSGFHFIHAATFDELIEYARTFPFRREEPAP